MMKNRMAILCVCTLLSMIMLTSLSAASFADEVFEPQVSISPNYEIETYDFQNDFFGSPPGSTSQLQPIRPILTVRILTDQTWCNTFYDSGNIARQDFVVAARAFNNSFPLLVEPSPYTNVIRGLGVDCTQLSRLRIVNTGLADTITIIITKMHIARRI